MPENVAAICSRLSASWASESDGMVGKRPTEGTVDEIGQLDQAVGDPLRATESHGVVRGDGTPRRRRRRPGPRPRPFR